MKFGHNALNFLVNFITYLEPPYSLNFNYIVVPLLGGFLWVHILVVEMCKKSSHSPSMLWLMGPYVNSPEFEIPMPFIKI